MSIGRRPIVRDEVRWVAVDDTAVVRSAHFVGIDATCIWASLMVVLYRKISSYRRPQHHACHIHDSLGLCLRPSL